MASNDDASEYFWYSYRILIIVILLTLSGFYMSPIKKFLKILAYQYCSDFYYFDTIQKRVEEAFEWYQNHQNPINIEFFTNVTITAKTYFTNVTVL